jgi:hypothetical protein
MPDFYISGGPTQFLVVPHGHAAKRHLLGNEFDCFSGLLVEQRELDGLVCSLEDHGFIVLLCESVLGELLDIAELERLAKL